MYRMVTLVKVNGITCVKQQGDAQEVVAAYSKCAFIELDHEVAILKVEYQNDCNSKMTKGSFRMYIGHAYIVENGDKLILFQTTRNCR